MDTKSFTFRLPTDLLGEIEKKAGKGKRSEFIIQVLREGLGLSDHQPKTDLTIRLSELDAELERMRMMQDTIFQRLTYLEELKLVSVPHENVLQRKTNDKTGVAEQRIIEYAIQSTTERKTEYADAENLSILPEEKDDLIEAAEKINSAKLLAILRREEPQEGWHAHRLQNYRTGKKKQKVWHEIKQCKFKYAEEIKLTGRPEHFWWVIYSPLTKS